MPLILAAVSTWPFADIESQESFQNYAQSGNFGTDQSFGFFGGNAEQPGADGSSSGGFTFSTPSMTGGSSGT